MRIEVKNLRHTYSPGTDFAFEALRGVSLSVEEGEILGIVGGTGSGKSTLVMHMNLLLEPTEGEVLVVGVDAAAMKKSELRRKVGLVFQFPESALFAPTVREDVAFGPGRLGLSEDEVRERVDGVLGMLGIPHLASRSPHALSGGEKRRVAIAGVLAMGPEVLILDEPTAGLDPATREELLGVVRGLKESGMSIVIVSHDLDEISEVSDRVCLMERGEIKAVGKPADVFYEHPENAPATVRAALAASESLPGIGRPVRFHETVEALEHAMENASTESHAESPHTESPHTESPHTESPASGSSPDDSSRMLGASPTEHPSSENSRFGGHSTEFRASSASPSDGRSSSSSGVGGA